MNIKELLATAAMTAGLAIGLAANANAAPVSAAGDDFWECAAGHPDDIGVCCVFYGGDYDERTGECWIDDEAKLEEASPGPSVPPTHSVLTRVDRLPVYKMG
jgi:nitrite reductase/ring-hydroxylating ferredoxin subunit